MICDRRDLNACLNWLASENATTGKPSKGCRTAILTFRGWPIYEPEGNEDYCILPMYHRAIFLAPWLVAELIADATR